MKLTTFFLLGVLMMVPCVVQGMDREEAAAAGLATATKAPPADAPDAWKGVDRKGLEEKIIVLQQRFEAAAEKYEAIPGEAKEKLIAIEGQEDAAIDELKEGYASYVYGPLGWLVAPKRWKEYRAKKAKIKEQSEAKREALKKDFDLSMKDSIADLAYFIALLRVYWQARREREYTNALNSLTAIVEKVEVEAPAQDDSVSQS